jgi:hypothetical protein
MGVLPSVLEKSVERNSNSSDIEVCQAVSIVKKYLENFKSTDKELQFQNEDYWCGPNERYHSDFLGKLTYKEVFDAVIKALETEHLPMTIIDACLIQRSRVNDHQEKK